MTKRKRIVLTGFMGVGKSSVARHISHRLGLRRADLDNVIEHNERREIAEIVDDVGEQAFRLIETANLRRVLEDERVRILSLGGGAWTIQENRELLKASDYTSVWLEADFEHCWLNITFSKRDRPLARDKQKAIALFEERQKVYCLADWHFIIRPGQTSYDVARQILDEIYS